MIKKYKIFEAHLRGHGTEDREFKISSSVSMSRKLLALEQELSILTELQNENQISFLDLTKTGVHLELDGDEGDELGPTDIVILVMATTFHLRRVNQINIDEYKIFRITDLPDNFPSRYAVIKEIDFMRNKPYSTLNLNKIQRGSDIREQVFTKLLALESDTSINTGVTEEFDGEDWQPQINYFFIRFPDYEDKMADQVEKIVSSISEPYDLLIKDYSKLFMNEKARELFNAEYGERQYNFNVDKWNPSDVWIVKGDINEIKRTVNNFTSLVELNDYLLECVANSTGLIGISLKLSADATTYLDEVNTENAVVFEHRYNGYDISETSMSVIINYTWIIGNNNGPGKIDIRNFSGGRRDKVDLEIRSTGHMSGKLTGSLRPLFTGIQGQNNNYYDLQNLIVQQGQTKENLLATIDTFELVEDIRIDFENILNNEKEFDYKEKSKLQGLLIVNKIVTHIDGADSVIDQMINYGRSQTDVSAPHYILK